MGPHKEVGPRDTTPEGTDNIITTSHREATGIPHLSDTGRQCDTAISAAAGGALA
jgi:hypothetical protein